MSRHKSREHQLLSDAFDFVRDRSAMVVGHVIKARAGLALPLNARQRHLDLAIVRTRQILDELVTKRLALGWDRKDDAA